MLCLDTEKIVGIDCLSPASPHHIYVASIIPLNLPPVVGEYEKTQQAVNEIMPEEILLDLG